MPIYGNIYYITRFHQRHKSVFKVTVIHKMLMCSVKLRYIFVKNIHHSVNNCLAKFWKELVQSRVHMSINLIFCLVSVCSLRTLQSFSRRIVSVRNPSPSLYLFTHTYTSICTMISIRLDMNSEHIIRKICFEDYYNPDALNWHFHPFATFKTCRMFICQLRVFHI